MKTSLNGARLGAEKLSLAEFVELAARHGFDGVDFGIGAAQKLGADGGAGAARAFFAEKKVAPAVFGMDVEWRKDEDTFNSGLAALGDKAAFAQALGSDRCTTWMPPSVNSDVSEWHAQTVRRFREIARVLGDSGVRFGIEWVGPHHLRAGGPNAMGPGAWIHTMQGTLDLIADIGQPNVGLLVDCYHCYTTGIGETEIARLSDAQIVHVHVNDAAKGLPPEAVKDGERLLPGEGAIDLAGFVRGLRAANYSGFIAAEVLAPQPIAGDAETAAAKVRAALQGMGL